MKIGKVHSPTPALQGLKCRCKWECMSSVHGGLHAGLEALEKTLFTIIGNGQKGNLALSSGHAGKCRVRSKNFELHDAGLATGEVGSKGLVLLFSCYQCLSQLSGYQE